MKKHRNDLRTRVIKNFSDILMLKYLKANPESTGYQILRHLHDKYNIRFSPGTIYNEIYSLERKTWIKSANHNDVRVFSLTVEGEKALSNMIGESTEIQQLLVNIFSNS